MKGGRNFSGCVDEVRVYGGVLSEEEAEKLAGQSVEPNANAAPQVALGSDQTIVLPDNATVAVSVVDPGDRPNTSPASTRATGLWTSS